MGRQAYITRLALGRSPFEEPETNPQTANPVRAQAGSRSDGNGGQHISQDPNSSGHYVQQYNERGHPINPTSRYSTRTLIRAQNDVLATVGVVTGATDATGLIPRRDERKARERLIAASRENQIGLVVLALDVVVLSLATCWITGLRYRLQIYPMLNQLSLVRAMTVQINEFGSLAFAFAGLPSYTVQGIGLMARGVLLNYFQRWALKRQDCDKSSGTSSSRGEGLRVILALLMRCISWFCLTPFGIYGELQQMFLMQPFPVLPGLSFLTQFVSMLLPQEPLQRKWFTLGSFKQWSASLLQSPVILAWAYSYINAIVDSQLNTIIRLFLPRIGNPDLYSVTAAKLDGLNKPLWETLDNDTNNETANRSWPVKVAEFLQDRWHSLMGKSTSCQTISDEDNQASRGTPPQNNSELLSAPQPQAEPTEGPHDITTRVASTIHPANDGHDTVRPTISSAEDSPISADASPVEPPVGTLWVAHHRGEDPASSRVRLHHTRRRQNEAVPSTSNDSSSSEGPFQQPLQSTSPSSGPKHRITCLSEYPLNALNSHLSAHLAALITLPLETYVIRRMVGSFLATGGSPYIPAKADPLAGHLFSLLPNIGTRILLQSFIYPRQLFLNLLQCMAIELTYSSALVVAGSRGVLWYGTRYFGWRGSN